MTDPNWELFWYSSHVAAEAAEILLVYCQSDLNSYLGQRLFSDLEEAFSKRTRAWDVHFPLCCYLFPPQVSHSFQKNV